MELKIGNKDILKKVIAVGCAVTFATTALSACSNSDKDSDLENSISISKINDDELINLSFDELMKILEDGTKKNNSIKLYNFIENFNGDFSESLKLPEDKDARFRITWDTAVAMQLAYNDYTTQQMYMMFDSYEMNASTMYSLVKGYTTMAIPAYMRLKNNTEIDCLIGDEEIRNLYIEFENQLIKVNKTRFEFLSSNSKEDKLNFENEAEKFNKLIRKNLLNDNGKTNFGSLSKSYTSNALTSLIPLISAGMEITRSTPSALNKNEVKKLNLDGYCNTAKTSIEQNLNKLQTIQSAFILENKNNEPTTAEAVKEGSNYNTRNIEYVIIREAAIRSLKSNNIYYISDEKSTLPIIDFNKNVIDTLNNQSNIYNKNYQRKSKTISKKYNSMKSLSKDHPELVSEAKKQEKKLREKYAKENEKNRKKAEKEASSKAYEKSKENESKADKEMQDKNTTAKVKDNNGNTYNYTVTQGSNKNGEYVGNVVIDDKHTTNKNGNSDTNFDGPIYDANGNIIAGSINLIGNTYNYTAKVMIKSFK